MAWSTLGTITPDFNLAYFSPAVKGDALLRVTQSYTPNEVTRINRLYLWERYPTGDLRFLRTLYPSTEQRVLPITLPKPMKDAGWLEREIGVKHGWAGVSLAASWSLSLELLTSDAALTVDWRITDTWETGYAAEILIYNPSLEPVSDYAVTFEANNVTEVWGAELEEAGTDLWVVTPSLTTGSTTIFPGETRVVGIVADGVPNLQNLTLTRP